MKNNPHPPTDTQLLDFLQRQLELSRYTGRVIFRYSKLGRGWRLHETNRVEGVKSVRHAITKAMEREFDE